jgi:hypothetical protein
MSHQRHVPICTSLDALDNSAWSCYISVQECHLTIIGIFPLSLHSHTVLERIPILSLRILSPRALRCCPRPNYLHVLPQNNAPPSALFYSSKTTSNSVYTCPYFLLTLWPNFCTN